MRHLAAVALLAGLVLVPSAGAKQDPPKAKDHVPPKPPAGLTAVAGTASVSLSWEASKDNKDVAGYRIYLDGARIGSTDQLAYVVAVPCGTTHGFGVDAVDTTGNASAQATLTATARECGGPALFVAPGGTDAGACRQSAPCATFDRAYRLAAPGERVEVAGGSYPTQTVGVDPTKLDAPANVVIAPADGAQVEIAGDLIVYGSHVTFRDLKLRKLDNQATSGAATSHDVVFDNLDGETFNIGPNYRITIKGGDWGPSTFCFARRSNHDPKSWCPPGSPYATTGNTDGSAENHIGPDGDITNQWPHDIVIDGARIHDQNSLDLPALHTGGLFLISGYDIAIRNTIFQQDAVYDIQVQDFSNPDCCGMTFGPVHDVVLENNWFGPPVRGINDPGGDTTNDNQAEVQFDPRNGSCWSNWLIRFNSFHNGFDFGFDGDPCFSNVRAVGNVGTAPSVLAACYQWAPGISWEANAWVGGTCGASDVELAALPYQSTTIGSENYHLTGGAAVDLVPGTDPDQLLATDIDGQSRPLGRARDAGSDELR